MHDVWSALVNYGIKRLEHHKTRKNGNPYPLDFVVFENASGWIIHANYADLGWMAEYLPWPMIITIFTLIWAVSGWLFGWRPLFVWEVCSDEPSVPFQSLIIAVAANRDLIPMLQQPHNWELSPMHRCKRNPLLLQLCHQLVPYRVGSHTKPS